MVDKSKKSMTTKDLFTVIGGILFFAVMVATIACIATMSFPKVAQKLGSWYACPHGELEAEWFETTTDEGWKITRYNFYCHTGGEVIKVTDAMYFANFVTNTAIAAVLILIFLLLRPFSKAGGLLGLIARGYPWFLIALVIWLIIYGFLCGFLPKSLVLPIGVPSTVIIASVIAYTIKYTIKKLEKKEKQKKSDKKTPTPDAQASLNTRQGRVTERLAELEELHSLGFLSEEEYHKKRKEIISDL